MEYGIETKRLVGLVMAVIAASGSPVCAASLTIAEDGQTPCAIYVPAGAVPSVQEAAEELQRVVRIATGAGLQIVNEPQSPMIGLGDSPSARQAGIDAPSIPFGGYRILSKGRDLFIVGRDTTEKEAEWFAMVHHGTRDGVYAFLEKTVGVRWLGPGDLGEEIPRHETLTSADLDIAHEPVFRFRYINMAYHVPGERRRRDDVLAWKDRHRIGRRHWFSFGHSWDDHPPTQLVRRNPEWMAMHKGGIRQAVPKPGDKRIFYCLSQQGLLDAYAQSLIDTFVGRPDKLNGSLSSSDGYSGCDCAECLALTLSEDGGKWNDFGGYGESITPLVLRYYYRVAHRVGQACPNRYVGGLIYRNYVFPPDAPSEAPDNLVLNVAILHAYGFKMYKDTVAEEFPRLMDGWTGTGAHLAWTDYSTWMRNRHGAILPPGLPILKRIFPVLRKHRAIMVNWTGRTDWGPGAVHNYIVAHLLDNPDADPHALYDEYLDSAFGPAAPFIDRIFGLSEQGLRAYVRKGKGPREPSYDTNADYVKEVCAPIYAQVESLYFNALERAETPRQRKRLERFGNFLIVQNYNLRHGGLLPEPGKTRLYKSDDDYVTWLNNRIPGYEIDPHMMPSQDGHIPVIFVSEEVEAAIPYRPEAAPDVDGALSEPVWKKAAVAAGFRRCNTGASPSQPTEVRVFFGDTHLYIGARCEEAEIGALAAHCDKDDSTALFDDDTFEVFLGHRGSFRRTYWQLAFNPRGARYDAVEKDSDYDLSLTSAVQREHEAWTVEIAIPFEKLALKGPPFGRTWRGNFCRSRSVGQRESSSWAPLPEGFHDPGNFGTWVFADRPRE